MLRRKTIMKKWLSVPKEKCELAGPYECPACGYHCMIDTTFLDQVQDTIICPSCVTISEVPE